MIHTATLTLQPSQSTFQIFQSNPKTYFLNQENIWMNKEYKSLGIVITGQICKFDNFQTYLLTCRINFKRLIEQQDRLAVYTDDDYQKMVTQFNTIMVYMGGLPTFENWNVNRIDYCINIKTPYVKEYISLMQKGDIPAWQRLPFNPISKRYTNQIGSIYLPAKSRNIKQNKTGSITINFYNKHLQQSAEALKNNEISEAILKQSEDVLRLEVQCHRPKIDSLKKRYNLENKKIIHYLAPQISFDVLESAIKSVCHLGDYQRKSVALGIIETAKGLHQSTRDDLKSILIEVNRQHQSISKARDSLVAAGYFKRDKFNNLIKKLDELNINPVTISDNKSIVDKTQKEGLENIYIPFFNSFNQFN